MTDKRVVFVTVPDLATGEAIAGHLLDAKVAACATILPGAISIYNWEGKRERTQECLLLIKTRANSFPALRQKILQHHPYKVPEIVAVTIEAGLETYLHWIDENLNPTAG